MTSVYLIGSLRNPAVPVFGEELRQRGLDVFDDWFSAGAFADDSWRDYEKGRGHSYSQALKGYAARHVFEFDKKHLDRCDGAILLMPAGRSGHLELGYTLGKGKWGFVLFEEEPERYDVMFQFATGVHMSKESLFHDLKLRGLIR